MIGQCDVSSQKMKVLLFLLLLSVGSSVFGQECRDPFQIPNDWNATSFQSKDFGKLNAFWPQLAIGLPETLSFMSNFTDLKSVPVGVIDGKIVLSGFTKNKISTKLVHCWKDTNCQKELGYLGGFDHRDSHGTSVANIIAGKYPVGIGILSYISDFKTSRVLQDKNAALEASIINLSMGPLLDNLTGNRFDSLSLLSRKSIVVIASGNSFPMRGNL